MDGHDWTGWLGPAAADLTPEQRRRFDVEADRIAAHYAARDEADRVREELSAGHELPKIASGYVAEVAEELRVTLEWVLGELVVESVADDLARARADRAKAMAAAQQVARLIVREGVSSKYELGPRLGLSKATMDAAVGR